MNYGVHEVPRPLQDEDKWFKLTKRQWVIVLPAMVISIVLLRFFFKMHLLPIGIAATVLIMCIAVIMAWFELPPEKYLFGTGIKLDKLVLRLLKKQLPKNKVIYTKNYDNGYREWVKKL